MSQPLWRFPFALAAFAVLSGCDDGVSTPVPNEDPANLVETAVRDGSFTTLLAAAEAAGLAGTLADDGPFTLFAPTDDAFERLPEGTLEGLLDDPTALSEVLLYHTVPGVVLAEDLVDGALVTTVEGREFRVTLDGGARVNGVSVAQTDIAATNGVIHVLDGVLVPVRDNVDTTVGAGFSTLVQAVQAAGLEDVLRGEGPFTVFAPTNEAFDDLPDGTLEELLDDPEALGRVLTYHVVSGRVFASDLEDGMEVSTVEGSTVRISLAGTPMVNDAEITATDILTSNGVIHVIDAVLVPEE